MQRTLLQPADKVGAREEVDRRHERAVVLAARLADVTGQSVLDNAVGAGTRHNDGGALT